MSTPGVNQKSSRVGLRKHTPKAKLPAERFLAQLSTADRRNLEQLITETAECVFAEEFAAADAHDQFMGPVPDGDVIGAIEDLNDDSGAGLYIKGNGRTLTTEQEHHLFNRLNYCRFRVMQILKHHVGEPLSDEAARDLLYWSRCTANTREEILRVNLPLVLAMAKRTRIVGVDPAELISEGNLALLRSVDKFDCARGFKFSTYACRAILKSFSRVATRTSRYRTHFPTEFDPSLEKSDHLDQKRRSHEEDCVDELRSILGRNLAQLSDVEQTVIRERFAIAEGTPQPFRDTRGKTLEQVGELIGVTKERVRQIQNKALGKLRHVLAEGVLAI